MAIVFQNNARTTLASGISSSATSITVTDGSVLPSPTGGDFFFCTFDDGTNSEIVKVTARSGNTLTVVRAQDDTTARSFVTGDLAELRLIKAVLESFPQVGSSINEEVEAYLDANGTTFPDNVKAQFGDGNDLQIYHDGSNSHVRDQGTGDILISASDKLIIRDTTDGSQVAVFDTDGAVSLNYGNSTKFATTSSGVNISGTVTSDGLTVDGTTQINGTSAGQLTLDATGQYNQITFEQNSGNNSGGDIVYDHTNDQLWLRSLAVGSLHLKTGTTAGNTVDRLKVASNGDISFYEDTGTTAQLFWDSSAESLGIGATVPDAKLRIDQDAIAVALKVTGGGSGVNIAEFKRDVGSFASVNIHASGGEPQITFVDANTFSLGVNSNTFEIADNTAIGTNTRFAIDNAGAVTIGGSLDVGAITSSGSTSDNTADALTVKDSSNFELFRVRNDGVVLISDNYLYVNSSQGAYFDGIVRARNGITDDTGELSLNSFTGNITFNSTNLTNIGTISSGAITTSGDITLANDKDIHFLKADGTNDGTRITRATGNAVRFKFGGNALIFDSLEDTDFKVYNSVGDTIFLIDSNSTATSSSVNVNGKFKVGGTQVIDNSLNLTNIGSISASGAITSTGIVTATGGNSTNWNTAYGWGNHASQSYATQSYVGTQISNLVDSSPAALNTLNELASALGDDANFSTTVNANIATKLPLAGGTMTGLLEIAKSTSIGDPTLDLHNTTNGYGVNIRMTDISDQSGQFGYITYYHQDSKSYGSGASITLRSTESTTTILADGKLMYGEGIYSKPGSGTGAGTRKDANWDTAYGWGNHASAGYITSSDSSITNKLPKAGGSMTGTLTLNNADSLSFESGRHWITYNDGEGNFNLRVGHKSDSNTNEVSTETGYAFQDEWSQSAGWREFNISASSISSGADVGAWRRQMYYDSNSVYLAYQGSNKLNTNSSGISVNGNIDVSGTVDGVDIVARNSVLTSTTTTANAALPKAGGTVTGDINLTSTATTSPAITFNTSSGTDTTVDMAIRATGEGLDFYEPEDNNKIHMRIVDDTGVNAVFGFRTGAGDGTARLDASGNLINIGTATFSGRTIMGGDGARVQIANSVAADTSNLYTLAVGSQGGNKSILAARNINTTAGGYQINGATIIDASQNFALTGTIRQTVNNVGIPTSYGSHTMEATDAQIDLVSSSSGSWGSAINFVEGASTSSNTNVWSIARKTSSASNSLHFNFGTNNQHDNTSRLTLSSSGNATFGGNITLAGTVDGVDIAARDAVLTSTTTTANAALPAADYTDVFKSGSEIAGSQNLNNYRTTGYYSQDSNADATSGSNYPVDLAGILEVITGDQGNGLQTEQRYSRYNNNTKYVRHYYNGTWTSWAAVYNSSNFTDNSANWNTAYTVANAALPKAGGTMTSTLTSRDIKLLAGYHLQRSDHHSGHLEGSYNNIGANGSKTNPIYTIGSSYNPNATTLNNMYGIGYCNATQAGFVNLTGTSGWGMYVASSGSASVFLDGQGGTIHSTGAHYVGANAVYHAGNKPSLATLGYTGASNANYITNNNQLTNGASYITASNSAITNKLPLAGGTLTGNLSVHTGGSSGTFSVGRSTSQRFKMHVTDGLGTIDYLQDETGDYAHDVNFNIISPSTHDNEFKFSDRIVIEDSVAGDATLLALNHDVVSDLGTQRTFIDFSFTDTNANETPQVRIGAQVGANADAGSQTLEGCGAFIVHTNNANTISGDAGASLVERLRVDYQGNVGIANTNPGQKLDVTGNIAVSGTVDGVDIAARNAVLTTTTNTANAALPKGGGTMTGQLTLNGNTISMGNGAIVNANNLTFNDPGVNEGVKWEGGNLWQIYESPDAQTNSAGNLQFTSGTGNGTKRFTITTDGYIGANRTYFAVDRSTGYFYNDSGARTAYTGGDFYIKSDTNNTYLYSTNTYMGASSGDTIHFRGNTVTANSWSINSAGTIAGAAINSAGTIAGAAIRSTGGNYYGNATTSVQYRGFGDTPILTGVSGATYLYAGGSTTTALTLQAGRTVAPILSIGQVNAYSDVITSARAVQNITSISMSGNLYMNKSQPWVIISNTTEDGGGIAFTDNQADTAGIAGPGTSAQAFRMTYHSGNNSFVMGHDENSYTGFSFASGGSFTASGDVVAYSDERLKSNIQTLDGKKALQMRGVSFEKDGKNSSGVIAQEIEKIAPELVHTSNDEMKTKSVAYGNLVGYLIEAIKDQQKEIEYMKLELKLLKENNNGD